MKDCCNCENFNTCLVAEFESPETCGCYEGEETLSYNEDEDPFEDFMNN